MLKKWITQRAMKETFLKDIQTEEIEKDKETEKSNRKNYAIVANH